MKKFEALMLLTACKKLSARLAASGVNIELTEAEQAALEGFNRVALANWLEDGDIYRMAGLSRSDIGTLNLLAAVQNSARIKAQHDDEHLN